MNARAVSLLALAALAALLMAFRPPVSLGQHLAAAVNDARPSSDVPASPRPMPIASPAVSTPRAPQPPPLPFAFLGRITEGGVPSILLHANGRVVPVRGVGALDDRYQVEAIFEDRLLLRHRDSGAVQTLALSARPHALPLPVSPEEFPQD